MSPLSTTCAVAACNDVDRRAVEFRLRPEDVCLDAVAARVSLQPFEAPAIAFAVVPFRQVAFGQSPAESAIQPTARGTRVGRARPALRQEMYRRMFAGYSSLRSRQSMPALRGRREARMSRPAFAR